MLSNLINVLIANGYTITTRQVGINVIVTVTYGGDDVAKEYSTSLEAAYQKCYDQIFKPEQKTEYEQLGF